MAFKLDVLIYSKLLLHLCTIHTCLTVIWQKKNIFFYSKSKAVSMRTCLKLRKCVLRYLPMRDYSLRFRLS